MENSELKSGTTVVNGKEVRFRTFNVLKNDKRIGKIVAATVNVDDKKEEFKLGLSFCSTKEVFNKHIGRSIAMGRALNDKTNVSIYRESDGRVIEQIKKVIPIVAEGIYWVRKVRDNSGKLNLHSSISVV